MNIKDWIAWDLIDTVALIGGIMIGLSLMGIAWLMIGGC
jgi:hypothetical protein